MMMMMVYYGYIKIINGLDFGSNFLKYHFQIMNAIIDLYIRSI